jgi:hypothetical protein
VKDAYTRSGWSFKPHGIAQCAAEAFKENMKDQFATDGGCQLYGHLELNKASGTNMLFTLRILNIHVRCKHNICINIFINTCLAPGGHFHIAPHKAMQPQRGAIGTLTLLDLIFFTFEQFNVTHTINSLSFGDQFPGTHISIFIWMNFYTFAAQFKAAGGG